MENIVDFIGNVLTQKGWTVEKNTAKCQLPEEISNRYSDLPADWLEFSINVCNCINAQETVWFLCSENFKEQDEDSFRWNEFELISLQAAIDEEDSDWQQDIQSFWDHHLPIILSVKDGYEYYAIRIDDGCIVHGSEPEFEETEEVAVSFEKFIEAVSTGEIIL